MTNPSYTSEQLEAVQAVVDRVSSYQESAPEGFIESELREGLIETGVELPDEQVTALAEAIEAHDRSQDAAVHASDVLPTAG